MSTIERARRKKNLTQKELGDLVGVTAQTISNAETGNIPVSAEVIEKIEKILWS